ncbi:MAG TPA: PAS domain-containing sensor histidine kinase, partial [Rikenellaceae bacterium]|nr:PAS domain-containing sensor histidine kinase [Rikenellaceae bacterium]
TINRGNVWTGEISNYRKNGEHYWESAIYSPIFNEKGEILNFLAIKKDVTRDKQLAAELVHAKEKAEESDRLKSAFLANISHEIRTPMNGIMGFAELLREPDLSSEQIQEYIQIIEKSGQRMLNLINDITDIARIEAGQMKYVIRESNINEIVKEIYKFFLPEAERKGLDISFITTLSTEEAVFKTDRDKLYATLSNLIKNSLKFTYKGSIVFGYHKKGEFLEFFVKDTGIGIASEKHATVFERFIQADMSNSRISEGTGLGLSISKAYVEMLGGKMWLESEESKGSTFYFTLPLN